MRGWTQIGFGILGVATILVTFSLTGCRRDTGQPAGDGRGRQAHAPAVRLSDYERELQALDASIAALEERASSQATSWTAAERLAQAWMRRAGLTGDLHDYARAEAALDEAFRRAPAGAGPLLTRAQLNFTLHRLDRVEPDLTRAEQAVLVDDRTRARIEGLRADAHFQSGRYRQALEGFLHALELRASVPAYARLAHYHASTGDVDAAERLYAAAEALARDASSTRAWLHLQRGLLDLERGRTHEALAHYRDAEAFFDGWWLIEEHVAEIHALHGENERARTIYTDLVERTHNPELMGALAALVRGAERDRWIENATREHRARMQVFEAAALGHALDHFLEFGTDAHETVRLAERNHASRPGAPASIQLAAAYLAAGRTRAAHAALAPVLLSPFVSADLFASAAAIAAAEGHEDAARTYRERARALNPRAVDAEVAVLP